MILLAGVSGFSSDSYNQDLVGLCVENGINVVQFNHHVASEEMDCRLMDMSDNKHLDEVIDYVHKRYSQDGKKKCDIYLSGFSLGGNHVLRYSG
jgi:predicted alpha/beta-fold hydrolase